MNALVELIKKIGIFMIAAQAVIHFAPGQKYEKYMKLIVGIMILLQFLSPIYKILEGAEADWNVRLANMEQEMQADGLAMEFRESDSVAETVIKNIEEEIKTKLNNSLSGENYVVISVTVKLDTQGSDINGNNNNQYVLDSVRVAVRLNTKKNTNVPDTNDISGDTDRIYTIEKIQIQQVTLGEGSEIQQEQDESLLDSEQELTDDLRKRFSSVLGMEEKYMEVSVYGTAEEADG